MTPRVLAALGCGVVFGAGLAWSGMTDPARVIGFLDVAGGAWDPTLALVMVAALAVAAPGFALVRRRGRPLLDQQLHLPAATAIDGRLLAGAALFGAGWGLAGFCPGPAIAGVITGAWAPLLVLVAMVAGQWLVVVATRTAAR